MAKKAKAAGLPGEGFGSGESVPTGMGDPNNCVYDGKEYSPGSNIEQADGLLYDCVGGKWVARKVQILNPKKKGARR